ncbi:hypothetical protein [Acinetobacter calcoaceticus]|uniref:hypothetical protein n=1 Tax=Acinetobacter calcoaceticus TaxID=471 RepID=UPI001900E79A|nr:hypothetical protein [Acinetobacter calcoaceticus]MBJ9705498.1 hypothetical protein [Acinetobacter calcoaceticus]
MQITVLSLDSNAAQLRIESDEEKWRGVWKVHNLAPYHEQFVATISQLTHSQKPSELFNEIRNKYRIHKIAIF